ncbi:MAG: ribosome maturation factor RimP [Gammaproteobacteria bacterium]|nr:ribosome maturation factor RimP [Gammaproteobacteria bacterium]
MAAVADIVEPTLAGLGFELVELQLTNHGQFLRLFIDRPEGAGGINVDDCAAVSRHLMHLFAVEGVEYDRLEVSSPGLDRPLRKERDFGRFAGQKADIRLRTPDGSGRRRFSGILRGAKDGVVTLEVEGEALALELDAIERARLVPDLQGHNGRNSGQKRRK